MITFEHGYSPPKWTITENNVIGATKSSLRTLPNPSHSDTDTIYLAPNGLDTNPGTAASPKLTLKGALDATTITKNTVHIFSNGSGTDEYVIAHGITGIYYPPQDYTIIQVEVGEIAKITFAFTEEQIVFERCNLNGIYFDLEATFAGLLLEVISINILAAPGISQITNCTFEYREANNGTATALRGNTIYFVYALVSNFTNCEFFQSDTPVREMNIERDSSTHYIRTTGSFENNYVHDLNDEEMVFRVSSEMQNCLFGNILSPVRKNGDHGGLLTDGIITNSIFSNTIIFLGYDASLSRNNNLFAASSIYFLAGSYNIIPNDNTPSKGITDNIFNTEPLFFNESAGDYRLQDSRRQVGNQDYNYALTSPAVYNPDIGQTPGTNTRDLGPYDVSYIVATGHEFPLTTSINWPPKSIEFKSLLSNPVELTDIRGNPHNTYSDVHWEITFQFNDQNISNQQAWNLMRLVSELGPKRFYPKGVGVSLFDDSAQGDFDATDNSFTPNVTDNLTPYHWKDFWIIMNDQHYYIESNDDKKLYLTDVLGVGFPVTGTYSFSIEYMLVRTSVEGLTIAQEHYSYFRQGGSWREIGDDPLQSYAYSHSDIKLLSTGVLDE